LYEEWDACVECGLSLWDWYKNKYTVDFKNRVIGFYRRRRLVQAHIQEAEYDKK